MPRHRAFAFCCLFASLAGPSAAEDRVERFDRDPNWDGHNNRAAAPEPRAIRQDFGYSRTAHAGGEPGEIGGFLSPAAEPAYYAKAIPAATFDDVLSASGTLAWTGRPTHALIGFFNAGTLNEWRTPNTIALRVSGRGDVFYAWVEYATAPLAGRRRRAARLPQAAQPEDRPRRDRSASPPRAPYTGGRSATTRRPTAEADRSRRRIDDQTAVCHLIEGHKADGATFNRFGLLDVMKSADAGGEIWMDDVTINGVSEDFAADPAWDAIPEPPRLRVRERSAALRLRLQPDRVRGRPRQGGAGRPGLPGRLPLPGEDGLLRRPARRADAGEAAAGLGPRLPAAGRHRQHGADRLLPLPGQHGRQPVAGVRPAEVLPGRLGGRAQPRGLLLRPGLPRPRRRPRRRIGARAAPHLSRRDAPRLDPGLFARGGRRAGPDHR